MTSKQSTVERAREMLADYQDGATVGELEKMYGVSSRWVYMILKEQGVVFDRSRPRRAISVIHKHIADTLIEHAFDMEFSRVAMANRLGWSYQKMASAMQGTYEFTLLDLQSLATLLKMSYEELMIPKKKGC